MYGLMNYILESSVSITLLTLIYIIFLRKETFFRLNRMYLLGSIVFSMVLPFLEFNSYTPGSTLLPGFTVTPASSFFSLAANYGQQFSEDITQTLRGTKILVLIYGLGLLFFLGRFLYAMFHLVILIRHHEVKKTGKLHLVILKETCSPYSFLSYIFVGEEQLEKEGSDRIIEHETAHIKQGHSFDLILLELVAILQWFNPFLWIFKRMVCENHEFLADHAMLSSGVSRGYYQQLLLEQFTSGQLILTNNFNYSLIKNRIKMMTKNKSPKISYVKIVLGLVTACTLVIVFASNQNLMARTTPLNIEEVSSQAQANDEDPDITHANMPTFVGGQTAMMNFISENIVYPKEAFEKKIEGQVIVTLTITAKGKVTNAKVAKGVCPSLDKEALRIVNLMPDWTPGTLQINGQKEFSDFEFTLPISFKLE